MNDYVNENEQWDAIKLWWKKNGLPFFMVVTIGLAAGFGWRYWQSYQETHKQEASQLFDQFLSVQTEASDPTISDRIIDELKKNYRHTVYTPLTALFEAKTAVEKNDLLKATEKLQWALETAKPPELKQIIRVRLARVLLADKKPDQAMHLLEKIDSPGFSSIISQVKGDIYLAKNQTDSARTAYQNALNTMPSSALKTYVDMQLNQLPVE
jgi:predicted negative regulator of RcsB-dependent stress response